MRLALQWAPAVRQNQPVDGPSQEPRFRHGTVALAFDAMTREDEIAMVRRHVLRAERQVARQRAIVATLRTRSADTTVADQLLAGFEDALARHRAHLARLTPR